jgi:hypothetical protein
MANVEDPQVAILRKMTPEQKLAAAERLYWSARQLKEAALRAAHPDWSQERIERQVRKAFLLHRDS